MWHTISVSIDQFLPCQEPKRSLRFICLVIGGDHSKFITIEIGKADTEKMTCLLTALKYGIEKIAETNYNKTFVVEPWQGKTLNFQLNGSSMFLFLLVRLTVQFTSSMMNAIVNLILN